MHSPRSLWLVGAMQLAACSLTSLDGLDANRPGVQDSSADVARDGADEAADAIADAGADAEADREAEGAAPVAKLVFVTSNTFQGNIGLDPKDWDARCDSAAVNAGLGGTYVAWLSASASAALERINRRVTFKRGDGVVVTDGSRIVSGSIDAPIDRDENNQALPAAAIVWTGTAADGVPIAANCSSWTYGAAFAVGGVGRTDATDGKWTSDGNNNTSCDARARLYCLEK